MKCIPGQPLFEASDPAGGYYSVTVIWPGGETSQFYGIGLTADQIAPRLERVAAEIRDLAQPTVAAGAETR